MRHAARCNNEELPLHHSSVQHAMEKDGEKRCNRLILRVAEDPTVVKAELEIYFPTVHFLPLFAKMTSAQRAHVVTSFCSFDGQKAKIGVLKRFSNGRRETTFQKVLTLGCGMVLNYLESFLVRPRVIICDGSGDIGYDLHRHVTGICCAKFFPFYDEWLQLIGRIGAVQKPATLKKSWVYPSF